ncbi:hypothetical protein Tco_0443666 [Tanacetum coccineum]
MWWGGKMAAEPQLLEAAGMVMMAVGDGEGQVVRRLWVGRDGGDGVGVVRCRGRGGAVGMWQPLRQSGGDGGSSSWWWKVMVVTRG